MYPPKEEEAVPEKKLSASQLAEIKSIFVLYDANCNGLLEKKELFEALTASGYDDDDGADRGGRRRDEDDAVRERGGGGGDVRGNDATGAGGRARERCGERRERAGVVHVSVRGRVHASVRRVL